jgi:hypothetical protein
VVLKQRAVGWVSTIFRIPKRFKGLATEFVFTEFIELRKFLKNLYKTQAITHGRKSGKHYRLEKGPLKF